MNIKSYMQTSINSESTYRFNDIDVDPSIIQAILINEIVPMHHLWR